MDELIVSVDIPLDDDGFLDRQCPSEHCGRSFKVLHSDWETSDTAVVTCPFCGHQDEPNNFATTEQQAYFEQYALNLVQEQLRGMLGGLAKSVNRRQSRNSLFSVSMTTKFADLPQPVSPEVVAAMRLQIACERCGCTYAVVGAGFFCPLCGHNSARQTFAQALTKAQTAVSLTHTVAQEDQSADAVAEIQRDTLENQIKNLVTAFQRLAESVYPDLPQATTSPRRNLFQNLQAGSEAWQSAGGRAFESMVDASEWAAALRFFQQRHVLAHQDGFVDADYLAKSGDRSYRPGQRLVIKEPQVLRMLSVVEKLVGEMLRDLPNHQALPATGSEIVEPLSAKTLQLPGSTDQDRDVFLGLCQLAVDEDSDFLGGAVAWRAVESQGLTEEEFGESLEILESKSLIKQTKVLGSRNIPAGITMSRRGLELYFSHTEPDFEQAKRTVARLLIQGATSSRELIEKSGMSYLLIRTILKEYEARRWVSKVLWTGGGAVVVVTNPVHLKRFLDQ